MTDQNMLDLTSYFDLLGRRVRDKISGQEGVCDVLTFDLYGCVQIGVAPPVDKDGKFVEGRYLDVHRVQVIDAAARVMPRPSFASSRAVFDLLGKKARDRISGIVGVVSSIAFEVCEGNPRVAISPPVDKDGKHVEGRWMAAVRVEVVSDEQVMQAPTFSTAQPTYGATPQQHTHGPADIRRRPGLGQRSMTDRINDMLRDLDGLATAVGAVSPGPWRLGPRYDEVWIEDDLGKVVTLEKSRGYWFAKYMEALSPTTVFTLIRLAREGQRAERLRIEAKDYADSAQEDNERLREEKGRLERELVEWTTAAQRAVGLFDPVKHEVSPASLALTASAVKEANADLRDRVSKLVAEVGTLKARVAELERRGGQ